MNLQILEYLQPKSILDIGANVGGWSKEAKEVWPDAKIIMVEANGECKPLLEETGMPYIICLLSDEIKNATFYQRKCGGTSTGDSMYRENTDWYNDENVVETKIVTDRLDRLFKEHSGFDLIKIDVQSAELDVLRGGENLVKKAKYITMEIPYDSGHEPYNIGAPTRTEVLDYMNGIGFELNRILEDIVHPIHRYVIQQDVLFTRQ